MNRILTIVLPLLLAGTALCPAAQPASIYEEQIVPILRTYCFDCHGNGKDKGEVVLDQWKTEAAAARERQLWDQVGAKLRHHEMPPDNKPQPSNAERDRILDWIERAVFQTDCARPDPGRITLRRLNRAEYNNTIRDLLGVDFKPADDFPVDDSGHGFDNIADALSMPPLLIEKYLAAAQKIVDSALAAQEGKANVHRFPVDAVEIGYNARRRGDGWVFLNSVEEDDVAVNFDAGIGGEFRVRVRAHARQDSTNKMKLTFMLGMQPVNLVEVETNETAIYESAFNLAPGRNRVRAVVRRNKDGLTESRARQWKSGPEQKGAVFVEWLEIEGPLSAPRASTMPLLTARPAPGQEKETATRLLRSFVRRAYRRPATDKEIGRLVELASAAWRAGEAYENGLAMALQATLVSPHFLFRGELQPEPDNPEAIHPVNAYALASRLSYFLWSSMPDERLFSLAESNSLRRQLAAEIQRMLKDPKARALTDNFAGQWLQFRNLETVAPDREMFRDFDDALRQAMRQETELFFDHIVREDRSLLEFISADYTFVNARLARHYGIAGVTGETFERVSLSRTPRRGVLTHGSVLALTSNPTRTSPVKRGKWVLDNLLNAPPPPAPPNVPELKEGKELTGTLRQRMEQHRADPLCASCHARMDPIGFGLENFDAIGAWRDKDGSEAIDASGAFTTGESFDGALALSSILSTGKREQFVRCLAEKLLTYALGRGLEYYDRCAVDEMVKRTAAAEYRFSALVLAIAESTPFQKRRGETGLAPR